MKKDELISEVLGEEAVLTASDVYNKEFKAALMGGYDRQDVDEFLERIADAFEGMVKHNRALKDELDDGRSTLTEMREMESTLRSALASSQKFNENIAEAARREADALLEQARLAKQRAELEAVELPAGLRQEIEDLKVARNRIRTDLRAVLAAHSALLHDIPTGEDNAWSRAKYTSKTEIEEENEIDTEEEKGMDINVTDADLEVDMNEEDET